MACEWVLEEQRGRRQWAGQDPGAVPRWDALGTGLCRRRVLPAPRGDGGSGRVRWAHPGAGTLLPCWLRPQPSDGGREGCSGVLPRRCRAASPAPAPHGFWGSPGTRGEPSAGRRAALASFGALTSLLLSPADPLPEPRRGLAGLHLGASPRRQMPLHGRHPRPGHLLPRPAQPPAPSAHGEGERRPARR